MNMLTSESRQLLSDISQHVLHTNRHINIQHLPNTIHAAFIRDCDMTLKTLQIPPPQITYPTHIDSPATFSFKDIPAPIVRLINTELKKEMRWDIMMPAIGGNGAKVSLRFLVETIEPSSGAIEDVITWLHMLYKGAKGVGCEPPKELVCWFYLTSAKKVSVNAMGDSNTLSAIHANTAFTRTCVPINEIVIYRAEEWFKVFIHESIHAFGLDFSNLDDAALKTCAAKVRSRLGLSSKNTDVNVYEAYTEFWAEIINILFISRTLPLYMADAMIVLETAFSVGQMHKVLESMGLTIHDLMAKSSNVSAQYSENTSILSYYILKTVIMCNMDAFFAMQRKGGKRGENFITYVNSGAEIVPQFCNFVTEKDNMAQCIGAVNIPNTMRMTAWERQ